MRKSLLLLSSILFLVFAAFSQTTISYQDFESSGDTWNYTPYPNPYNVSNDTWDTVTSLHSGAITPNSGSYFWGMRDLDNPNGGGDFRHTLTFDAVDVSSYSNVEIVFYYYTDGFDGSDSIFYNVQYDNGTNWPASDDIELNKNTDAWTQVTVSVPAGTQYVRLQLSAHQNGGSDYAGFDNIVLQEGSGSGSTAVNLFYEPFETDLGAMSAYSVTSSTEAWEWANYGNPPGCAKMSGYNGGPVANEDWLITPAIDMTGYSNLTLHFDHAWNYADSSGLFVMISTDYDGVSDPSTQGTWTDITGSFYFPGAGWSFVDAGTVDISAYASATTYIAFKYTSTSSAAATWEVDNVTVAGDPPPVYIAGSFQGWNPGDPDYLMSMNANGIYTLTKTLPSGDNSYKVVEGSTWGDPNYPGTDQHIIMAASGDTTWRVNADADLVTHTLPVLAGNFFSAMGSGNDWDPTNLAGEMTDPDGDDVYTVTLLVPNGNWECKVTLNRNWDQSTGSNTPFTSNGTDSTTFTYDFTTNTTTVSSPPPPSAVVTFVVIDSAGQNYDGFYLKGSWGPDGNYDPAWNGGAEHSAFYDDGTHGDTLAGDHIWTCQQNLIPDNGANTWEWGVNDTEHNWIDGNWQFTVPDTNAQTQSHDIPSTPALIINEIMYNSPGTDEEWVELYNNTGSTINLENWKLLDDNASHTPIVFPAGLSIDPNDYFTVEIATGGNFPFTPDYDGSGNFALGNGGDAVRLYNADGFLVDIVNYDDNSPWPTEPDGHGPTLSLIDPSLDNSLPESWDASEQDGGTPGEINFPPVPYITVLDPNGGENIAQGSDYEIIWDYGYWDGNIEIDLQKGNGNPQMLVYNIPVSDSSWTWHVMDNQAVGDDYKIIITAIDTTGMSDESDTTFSIVEPYVIPDLVFTEIMYNPPESGSDSLEFLEIYNNGDDTVNMEGFTMTQGVDYTFPAITLYPSDYLLIAKDSMAMLNTFAVTAYQWTSGSLSNGGEDIELTDTMGNQVDYVDYDDQSPWDTIPDGNGPSLTLCNPDLDNSLPENWTHSINFVAVNADGDSIWATPGFGCQVTLMANFSADTTIVLVGDSVQFTDETTGNPTSWSWTFEGGDPATYEGETPPPVQYNTAGRWDVTLVVSDGTNSDSITREEYIWSGVQPEITDFVADETTVTVGSYTNFTSTTVGDSLNFMWTFQGATPETSTDENPQEIYYLIPADSLYDVKLVVNNIFGADTLVKEDYIHTIPDGLTENGLNAVVVYPNPAKDVLYISNPSSKQLHLQVVDIAGKVVINKTSSAVKTRINTGKLNKGVYFIRITDLNTKVSKTGKLIIN